MDSVLNFITNYYLVFLIIAIILVLSLIGYIVEKVSSRDIVIKKNKKENQ